MRSHQAGKKAERAGKRGSPDNIICLLVLGALLSCCPAFGGVSKPGPPGPFCVRASFLYDFPMGFGSTAGIDFPFLSRTRETVSRKGVRREKRTDYVFFADLGFYRYAFNNTGLMIASGAAVRKPPGRVFWLEGSLGIGILRTFYDGIVYEVLQDGTVKELPLFGRFYALTGVSLALGWYLGNGKSHLPVSLQIKPSLWVQYPYNGFLLPHISLEAGLKYYFKLKSRKGTESAGTGRGDG